MQEVLIITPVTPLVNLDTLIDATVQAAPMDDPIFRHEKYIGTIEAVKITRKGKFVQFKSADLVGMKWIRLERVIGFVYSEAIEKIAS